MADAHPLPPVIAEMVANMKDIINMGYKADELDQEERNLISVRHPQSPTLSNPAA